MIFFGNFLLSLTIIILVDSRGTNVYESSSVNTIVWNKWTEYILGGKRDFLLEFWVLSIHSHNVLWPFCVLHIMAPTLDNSFKKFIKLEVMEEVPAIRSWIHTLEYIGKGKKYVRKNSQNEFFLGFFFVTYDY